MRTGANTHNAGRMRVPELWPSTFRRSKSGLLVAEDGIQISPWIDSPFLREPQRAKRSNDIPEGAVVVTSFASTEEEDFYGTVVDYNGMLEAWDGYVSNTAILDDGATVNQGNLRYMHQPYSVGFCRSWELVEGVGILCHDTITDKDTVEQILDRRLTGTSLGWYTPEGGWVLEARKNGSKRMRFVHFSIAERSPVDAPATPGCSFQDIRGRIEARLRGRSKYVNGADVPSGAAGPTPPPADQVTAPEQRAKGDGMDWMKANGFLWLMLKPESDFIDGSLMYSEESPEGIIMRWGRDAASNWLDPQAIGFNERLWTQDQAEIYVARDGYANYLVNERTKVNERPEILRQEMPTARRQRMTAALMDRFLGLFKRSKENGSDTDDATTAAGSEADSDSASNDTPKAGDPPTARQRGADPTMEDDMTLEELKAALKEERAALRKEVSDEIEQRITRAQQPKEDPAPDPIEVLTARVSELTKRTKAAEDGMTAMTTQLAAITEENKQLRAKVNELQSMPQGGSHVPGAGNGDPNPQPQNRSKGGNLRAWAEEAGKDRK